jgi:hypothetical protein
MQRLRLEILCLLLAVGGVFTPDSLGQGTIIHIVQSTNLFGIPPFGVPWSHDFDLDGDRIPDYRFDYDGAISYVSPLGSNRQVAYPAVPPDMGSSLTPLLAGEVIGSSLDPILGQWVDQSSPNLGWHSMISGCLNVGCFGPFAYSTAFMGFDFVAGDGQRHFGWLRIDDTVPGGHVFVVDWAWAATPGESITAGAVPEPSTLGLLILGGIFLTWFRNRAVSPAPTRVIRSRPLTPHSAFRIPR